MRFNPTVSECLVSIIQGPMLDLVMKKPIKWPALMKGGPTWATSAGLHLQLILRERFEHIDAYV